MRKFAIAAAAVAAVASAPAFAANSGPYIGVGVTHDNVAGGGDMEGLGINGVGGTVFAGYDMPLSENTFVGVEANFDLATAKYELVDYALEADNVFGATVRLGANLNDSVALYARGGYQRGRMSTTIDTEKFSESRDGLRLGAGIEAAVSEQVSVRAEYNRTHFYPTAEDKALAESDNVGINNNQFSLAVVFGF
jgi:outer membrane immunogenic protein